MITFKYDDFHFQSFEIFLVVNAEHYRKVLIQDLMGELKNNLSRLTPKRF